MVDHHLDLGDHVELDDGDQEPRDEDAAEVKHVHQPGQRRPEAGNVVRPARQEDFNALLKVDNARYSVFQEYFLLVFVTI